MNAATKLALACAPLFFAGCLDDSPTAAQQLGTTSGFFTRLTPGDVYCELTDIGATSMQLSITFGPEKRVASVWFPPTTHKGERLQANATFQYQTGQETLAALEFERQAERVDPRLSESSIASAIEQRTSLYFPLHVHRLVVEPATLCDTTQSGAPIDDCLTVEPSSLEGARFWCHVSPTSPPELSQ